MRFSIYLFIFFLMACDSSSSPNTPEKIIIAVELTPLSPYHYQFRCDNNSGNCRNDYFFSRRQDWRSEDFRKELYKNVLQKSEKNIKQFRVYSLYVYEKTEKLNRSFQGDYDTLSGSYNADYMSYTRWKQGKMDMFYLIEKGNVVYDLLKNEEVNQTWEF